MRSSDPIFHPENLSSVWELVKVLKELAEKYGKTPAQVALNWLIMSSPSVIPIPGAKNPQQVEDNAGAVGWRLSWEGWRTLEELSRKVLITYLIRY